MAGPRAKRPRLHKGQREALGIDPPVDLEDALHLSGGDSEEIEARIDALDGMPYTVAARERRRIVWDIVDGHDPNPAKYSTEAFDQNNLVKSDSSQIAANHARALRAKVESDLTLAQWEAIRKSQRGKCVYCDQKRPLTIDHIVPISHRGPNIATNVVGACWACNNSKRARPLDDWLEAHGYDVDKVMARIARVQGWNK